MTTSPFHIYRFNPGSSILLGSSPFHLQLSHAIEVPFRPSTSSAALELMIQRSDISASMARLTCFCNQKPKNRQRVCNPLKLIGCQRKRQRLRFLRKIRLFSHVSPPSSSTPYIAISMIEGRGRLSSSKFFPPSFSTYRITVTQRQHHSNPAPSNMNTPSPNFSGRKEMERIRTSLPHKSPAHAFIVRR